MAVFAVPGPHAHAVGDHAPLLRGGAGHRAPGAHAEGVHPPAVFQVAGELVVRRAQGRVAGEGPVLGGVDEALGVLDAGTHGKGLGLQGQAQAVQQPEHVPGAVAHRQQHGLGRHSMVSRRSRDSTSRPVSCPAWDRMPVTLAEKRTSPPRAMISSRMRRTTPGSRSVPMWGLASVSTSAGAPAFSQLLQHLADAGVPGAGGELPVGEGAGAPLAKLHVALRV